MDPALLLRSLGALLTVLGLLYAALWAVRRWGGALPGRRPDRRLALVEKLSLDTRRSLALVRHDGREHLLLLAPEGALVVSRGMAAAPAFADMIDDDADR